MPGPDVRANDNVLGEMSTEPTATEHSGIEVKSERKLTVLETHGYVLGRTIGSGSYATVKVQLKIKLYIGCVNRITAHSSWALYSTCLICLSVA